MKKILITAILFAIAIAAFAQAAPDAVEAVEDVAKAAERAAEEAHAIALAAASNYSLFSGRFAAHISLAIAAAGCGLGQGKAVAAACEGIARNPQAAGNIRTTMIIGLALIEALVIYALVAAFAIS